MIPMENDPIWQLLSSNHTLSRLLWSNTISHHVIISYYDDYILLII